ncbi:trehalose-phosphatase [Zavarzinella formosa]|uniref:trehalose-phosphatase n=1 Tax=Zavarzinella formosa TaxID=360055 RepID=UPI0003029385|nr:trehalose-phosphatase [Zavarzinella formosa]
MADVCLLGRGWAGTVAAVRRSGRPVVLLFDYDGTLTPIVRHPSLARLLPEDRERLARLAAIPGLRLAMVSGRALEELRNLIGLNEIWYAGSGGAELDLDGIRAQDPRADEFSHVLDLLHDHLVTILARYPGTWAERKPVGMSLHYRGLLPLMAVTFRLEIARLTAELPWVRQRVVSEAIEITPAGGWDKGTAVEMILDRLPPGTYPVFIGDAANDAEAMEVVNDRGGLSVGIGEDAPTEACVRVHGPHELAVDLEDLIAELLDESRRVPLQNQSSIPVVMPRPGEPGILIVDADPNSRRRLSAQLGEKGWRVRDTGDPDEAVSSVRKHEEEIQVALVDLQLPGFRGAKTLAELGFLHPGLIRCGMSADVTPYAAAAIRRLSDTPLFTKPFAPDTLDRELRRMIAERNVSATQQSRP